MPTARMQCLLFTQDTLLKLLCGLWFTILPSFLGFFLRTSYVHIVLFLLVCLPLLVLIADKLADDVGVRQDGGAFVLALRFGSLYHTTCL